MNKFESFLKYILNVIFKEMPFNKEKADEGLEKIMNSHKTTQEVVGHGYDELRNQSYER